MLENAFKIRNIFLVRERFGLKAEPSENGLLEKELKLRYSEQDR
jgi:hypothetical protein